MLYPRPQLKRKGFWTTLDGEWKASILDSKGNTIKTGPIIVPFPLGSKECGFAHSLKCDETLIYEKKVSLATTLEEGEELILHFGAVDYECTIFIDGKRVLSHRGGYLPFSLTLEKTSFLLTLIVTDPTDTKEQERGKQKQKRGGIWYTPLSGIWQTVWIEKVPKNYIEKIKITPTLSSISLIVYSSEKERGKVIIEGKEYSFISGKEIKINIKNPHLWSPEDPFLYPFVIKIGEDEVESYFALRTFSVEEDRDGNKRLFLNGKSYFHHGLLDQGYYEGGLYTAKNEEEMVNDLLLIKRLGFNTLRKHIKVEPLRWYYHCDRIGILVWQDMVNGGGKYSFPIVSLPLVFGSHIKDNHYSLFKRQDKKMREEFTSHLLEMVDLLYNVPSIAMWVPFNEGWGQFDSTRIGRMVEEKDKTRTVDYTSGWVDQNEGSFKSIHVYFRPYKYKKDKKNRCVILSEFGGYGLKIDNHISSSTSFDYKGFKTKEELTGAIVNLYKKEIIPSKKKGLSASIYTQLSDVEDEMNGLITYDRKEIKVIEEKIREISRELIMA